MKILQFVRVLDCGGIEKFIFSNYEHMNREKFQYDFLLLRNQNEAYDGEAKKLGCNKICIDTSDDPMKPRKLKTYYQIYKAFKKGHYDIVHFQSVSPALTSSLILWLAKKSGIKRRILHAHLACDWRKYDFWRMIKYKMARNLNSMFCTDFLACSKLAAEYSFSPRVYREKKYVIVNNAIDASKFKFNQMARNRIRKEYGIENMFVIGNVSRLVKQKNHEFMIDQLAEILKTRKDCYLFLVGGTVESEPERKNIIEEYARKKGVWKHVIFAGERSDIADCLSAMDTFIFPSHFEGLGIVGVEAQASGLRVVAAKNYIPAELKIMDSFTWLDLNDSATIWANALLQPSIKDRESAYKTIENSDYNILRTSKIIENIYTGESQ